MADDVSTGMPHTEDFPERTPDPSKLRGQLFGVAKYGDDPYTDIHNEQSELSDVNVQNHVKIDPHGQHAVETEYTCKSACDGRSSLQILRQA